MKDKILLIGWNAPGGADVVVENLRREYERKGVETHVVKHNRGSQPRFFTPKGANDFDSFDSFLRSVDMKPYFAIHNHACTTSEEQTSPFKAGNVPYIYTVHSLGIQDALRSPKNAEFVSTISSLSKEERIKAVRSQIEQLEAAAKAGTNPDAILLPNQRYQMRHADKIVNMTDFGNGLMQDYYPEYAPKGVIIPNGSNFYLLHDDPGVADIANRLRQEVGSSRIVTFVGRLTIDKGAVVLAEAFNRVKKAIPDAKLIYVGDAPYGPEAVRSAVSPEYRGDVIITGWKGSVKDKKFIVAQYRISDVVVVPSFFESFGLTVLEAAMMGTPVVASAVDGLKTEFVDNQLAYGAMAGNSDNVADMILYLLSHPEQTKRNAEQVRKVVEERYSLDRISDSNLALYLVASMEKTGGYNLPRDPKFYQRVVRPTTPQEMAVYSHILHDLAVITGSTKYADKSRELREASLR